MYPQPAESIPNFYLGKHDLPQNSVERFLYVPLSCKYREQNLNKPLATEMDTKYSNINCQIQTSKLKW